MGTNMQCLNLALVRIMRYVLLLTLIFIIGCKSGKELHQRWGTDLPVKDELALNESFLLYGKSSNGYNYNLWRELHLSQGNEVTQLSSKEDSTYCVKLKLVNENQILASLIKNDILIDSLQLKGRIENNYFFIDQWNKKVFLIPFFWTVQQHQTILGRELNESLSVISLGRGMGMILFFGTSGGGTQRFDVKRTD